MGRVTRSTDSFPTLQTPAETRKEQSDGNIYVIYCGGWRIRSGRDDERETRIEAVTGEDAAKAPNPAQLSSVRLPMRRPSPRP